MNEVVTYSYDSWGKLLSTGGSLASTVGAKNPYRYRGYRYDSETGLYYLQSRYYDPNTGRFLNADDTDTLTNTTSELTDTNLFAYCGNNPVMRRDDSGYWWFALAGAYAAESTIVEVGAADSWNPTGWIIVGVGLVAIGVTIGINYAKTRSKNSPASIL